MTARFLTNRRLGLRPDRVDHQLVGTESQPTALFVSGGIGDVIALSCFLELPETLEAVYYATPKRAEVQAYLEPLCPPQTQHVSFWEDWRGRAAWYSLPEFVRTSQRHEIADAVDWSIASQFPQITPDKFRGLPPLGVGLLAEGRKPPCKSDGLSRRDPVACATRLPRALPDRYAVLQPFTTDKRDSRRDMTRDEIRCAVAEAATQRLPLVLINQGGDARIEHAPNLIDLQNQLELATAIAITLRASLFIGIDSWPSVIASKVLPADRLLIKTVNPHCRRWQHIYFAPHDSFEFLTDEPVGRLKELLWTE